MTPAELIATVTALLSGEPDPSLAALQNGGHDDRYPVIVESCPRPIIALDVEVEGRTMICGRVTVPENHDADNGATIPLAFVILKSRSEAPAPDPVIYLHGGPGGFVLQDIGTTSFIFDFARDRRDVISFDQRGAGISNKTVACFDELSQEFIKFAKNEDLFTSDGPLAKCLEEIAQSGVDLSLYNTYQNAKDVPAIVSALGYEEYNVYGISYGTKLGQEVMRSAPEKVRSVVLDSISRVDNPAYDTNGVPLDQAIGWVVDLCAEDAQCAEAYPDLEATTVAAQERLKNEPVTIRGQEIDEVLINQLMEKGNKYRSGPFMAYLPKAFTELSNGETTTAEKLLTDGFAPKAPDPQTFVAAYPGLSSQDKAMVQALILQATQMGATEQTVRTLLAALADDQSPSGAASTEQLLDDALSEMVLQMEPEAVLALTTDYILLGSQPTGKAGILAFIDTHVPAEFKVQIAGLVNAMSDEDVAAFYRRAELDTSSVTNGARMMLALGTYACQEDFPFNSPEGFDAISAEYRFPLINDGIREDTYSIYGFCDLYEKSPRAGFHEPVSSEIPVLATAGMKDTQTNPSAAVSVVRTLPNGQAVTYPEAGHGVIVFSKCAMDIAAAFLEDPWAKVNDTCVEGLKPKFLLPDGSFSDG